MKVHHIGYAVNELKSAAEKFHRLGYSPSGTPVDDAIRGVRIQFFEDRCGVKVELVAPLKESSPVSGWLKKNGNSPYHICYESLDIERDIAAMQEQGFMLLERPAPAPAMGQRRVAFLYSRPTGLLEFVENVHGPLDSGPERNGSLL